MTKKDEEDYRNNNLCRFCEKNFQCDKVTDHCHLTGRYRGPAQSIYNFNVTQDQSNFVPVIFHNFINYDCHLFFKTLVNEKNLKVKFNLIPKTN